MTMMDSSVSMMDMVPEGGVGRSLSEETIPPDLVDQLMAKIRTDGLELLGEGGVLAELTKRLLERALDEELTFDLGYERGDAVGHGSGNSRNGTTPKRVFTEIGPIDLDVPRDRNGTFEPQIVPKGVRRLDKFNENIIALYTRGLSTRDIRKELKRMYGVEISPDLVSKVTDGMLEELREWQNRPLDPTYPILYIDALVVKVRTQGVVTKGPPTWALALMSRAANTCSGYGSATAGKDPSFGYQYSQRSKTGD
jgi:putative transposase